MLKGGTVNWKGTVRPEIVNQQVFPPIENGSLKAAIEETGIRGVTSNPTIFQKAIAGSDTYDAEIKGLLAEGKDAAEVFQTVAVKDIQDTCDLFRPLYDETNGKDQRR